jgi:hypothetical protein
MAAPLSDTRPSSVVPTSLRAAGVVSESLGLAFGIAMAISLDHLARRNELPMTPFGFRAFGGGPFDALPRPAFVAMGWTLIATAAADVLAGIWLWQGRPRGARLVLATTPLGLALSAGFALPFLLAGNPIRAGLIVLGLRRRRS